MSKKKATPREYARVAAANLNPILDDAHGRRLTNKELLKLVEADALVAIATQLTRKRHKTVADLATAIRLGISPLIPGNVVDAEIIDAEIIDDDEATK